MEPSIASFNPSETIKHDCDTRDRRCAHAVGEEDIHSALELFDSGKHFFPDISRGSCRSCPKNHCHHTTSFFNSTDNSKRRVSTHLFWKLYLGPKSLVTDSLLKASWSRLDSCDHGIRGNGQAKQGAGAKICINPHHYDVPADSEDLLPALQVYCEEIGLALNLPTDDHFKTHIVLKLVREAFGNEGCSHDHVMSDVTRRFTNSVSMDDSPLHTHMHNIPFNVAQQRGSHLVFSAQQASSISPQTRPAAPSSHTVSSVTSASSDVIRNYEPHVPSLSEDVDLNLNPNGSTSLSPTTDFWPRSHLNSFSDTTLHALSTLVQPNTIIDGGLETLDNDVFSTPNSAGFLMGHLPPLPSTSDPSTTTSRLDSMSEGMDLSDEEMGQLSKVAIGPGITSDMSSADLFTSLQPVVCPACHQRAMSVGGDPVVCGCGTRMRPAPIFPGADMAYVFPKIASNCSFEEGDVVGLVPKGDKLWIQPMTHNNAHNAILCGVISRSAHTIANAAAIQQVAEENTAESPQLDYVCLYGIIDVRMYGPVKQGDLAYASVDGLHRGMATTRPEHAAEAILLGKVIEECDYTDPEGEHRVKAFISLNNNVLSGFQHDLIDQMRRRVMSELSQGVAALTEGADAVHHLRETVAAQRYTLVKECQELNIQHRRAHHVSRRSWQIVNRLRDDDRVIIQSLSSGQFLQMPDKNHHVIFATGRRVPSNFFRLRRIQSADTDDCYHLMHDERYLALDSKDRVVLTNLSNADHSPVVITHLAQKCTFVLQVDHRLLAFDHEGIPRSESVKQSAQVDCQFKFHRAIKVKAVRRVSSSEPEALAETMAEIIETQRRLLGSLSDTEEHLRHQADRVEQLSTGPSPSPDFVLVDEPAGINAPAPHPQVQSKPTTSTPAKGDSGTETQVVVEELPELRVSPDSQLGSMPASPQIHAFVYFSPGQAQQPVVVTGIQTNTVSPPEEFPEDSAVFIVNAATCDTVDFEIYAVSDVSTTVQMGSTSEEEDLNSAKPSSSPASQAPGRRRRQRPRVNSFSTKQPVQVMAAGPSYAVLNPPKAVVMSLSSEDNEWRHEPSALILTSTFI